MIIGYFDYLILAILIIFNVKFWTLEIKGYGCAIGLVLFGIILPIISMMIEITRVQNSTGIMDNFEVLYTYLKFPIYWILGVIQFILFAVRMSYQNKKKLLKFK